jgi:hypothetical protein
MHWISVTRRPGLYTGGHFFACESSMRACRGSRTQSAELCFPIHLTFFNSKLQEDDLRLFPCVQFERKARGPCLCVCLEMSQKMANVRVYLPGQLGARPVIILLPYDLTPSPALPRRRQPGTRLPARAHGSLQLILASELDNSMKTPFNTSMLVHTANICWFPTKGTPSAKQAISPPVGHQSLPGKHTN